MLNAQRRENEPDSKRVKFDEKLSTCSDSDQSGDDSTGLSSPPTQKDTTPTLPVWLERERHRPYFPLFLGSQTVSEKTVPINQFQLQAALDLRVKMLQTPFSPMANPLAQHLYLKAKEAFVQRNLI